MDKITWTNQKHKYNINQFNKLNKVANVEIYLPNSIYFFTIHIKFDDILLYQVS